VTPDDCHLAGGPDAPLGIWGRSHKRRSAKPTTRVRKRPTLPAIPRSFCCSATQTPKAVSGPPAGSEDVIERDQFLDVGELRKRTGRVQSLSWRQSEPLTQGVEPFRHCLLPATGVRVDPLGCYSAHGPPDEVGDAPVLFGTPLDYQQSMSS
jgi:hypothetical protein